MRRVQWIADDGHVVALEEVVMQCEECPHKARSKRLLAEHRRDAHPLTEAARTDDRIALLRGLVVELASKVAEASPRELPALAHRIATTSAALEEELGNQRSLAELNAEVERLRRTQPKENKSRVDQIAEQRARRRSRRSPKAASR